MKWRLKKPAWRITGPRLIFLGLISLLLLPAPVRGQPARPARVVQHSLPGESVVNQPLAVKAAAFGQLPWRCPLPPASVFFLQTRCRQYLETWPTPGSTSSPAWPEYVPEDGENLNY